MTMKTLLSSLVATSSAMLLHAADPITATSFEDFASDTPGLAGKTDAGAPADADNPTFFLYEGTGTDASAISNHVESFSFANRPDYFANADLNRYLSLSTEGGTLFRSLNAVTTTDDGPALGTAVNVADADVYIDTLVQFTPCEDAPVSFDGNRLAIWLGVSPNEMTTDNTEDTVTNLCVRAGFFDYATALSLGSATYTSDVAVEAGTWYRLTVKAVKDILPEDTNNDYAAFEIYINDELVEFNESVGTEAALTAFPALNGTTLLPSMVQGAALQAVGFQGTGAIDDLVVTTDKPGFMAVDFTITWDANIIQLETWFGDEDSVTITTSKTHVFENVSPGDTVTVVPGGIYDTATKVASGYEIDWANTVLQNVTMEYSDDDDLYVFTVGATGPYSISLVTKSVATPAPTVKPGAPVTDIVADTEAEALAQTGDIVVADSAAASAGQAAVLKKVATLDTNTGKWTVSVVIDETKIVDKEETVKALGEQLATFLSTTATGVTLSAADVTPGLYYSSAVATEVNGTYAEGTRVLATGSALTIPVAKPAGKGFIKIYVNMTAK